MTKSLSGRDWIGRFAFTGGWQWTVLKDEIISIQEIIQRAERHNGVKRYEASFFKVSILKRLRRNLVLNERPYSRNLDFYHLGLVLNGCQPKIVGCVVQFSELRKLYFVSSVPEHPAR